MSMTRKKAIEYLEWIRPKKPYTMDRKNVQEAIDMGIEALKEQRPHGEWTKLTIYESTCSCCKNVIDRQMFVELPNFCPNCGSDNRPKAGE